MMLTGDNGILQRAGEAKVIMDEQQEAEKIQLSYMAEKTKQLGKAIQANGLQEEIEKYGEAEVFDNGDGTFYVIYKDSGNCYFVDKNGNVTKSDKTEVISGVFAIIYNDGTMAFNTTGNTIEGKTVLYKTGDISQTKFETRDDVPWKEHLTTITTVTFEEEVKPMYTTRWFNKCENFTQIKEIQNLNTQSVKDMFCMFSNCSKLTTLDGRNFETKNVTDMKSMFYNCNKLTSLDVSNFDTTNVTNMYCMFYNCNQLTTLDVRNFDTSNVTDMSYMFSNCANLKNLNLNSFNTSKVTNMKAMFQQCQNLINLNVSNFDTSNVTDMKSMFYNCKKLTSLNLSNFDTSNVTNMNSMFASCTSLQNLNVSNFDTSNVTNMYSMFYNCNQLTTLDVSSFDTSNVTDMSHMFNQCVKITSLDVSSFDTKKVTDMHTMFQCCIGLTTIDVSNFDTSNVTDMSFMFGCGIVNYSSNLQEIKGLENFDTSKVTTMECMFIHQISLEELNLSSFDTSNVENMRAMFEGLNIEKIYVSDKWNTSKVTESTDMFGGKTGVNSDGTTYTYAGVNDPLKLTGGNGTKWDPEHIDKEYARIDTAVYENGEYVSGDKGYFSVLPEE